MKNKSQNNYESTMKRASELQLSRGKVCEFWNLPLLAPACLEVFLHLFLCVFLGNRIKPKLFVLLLHNILVFPPLQLIGWGKQLLSESQACILFFSGFCRVRWTQSWPSLREGQRCWVSKGQASSFPFDCFSFLSYLFCSAGGLNQGLHAD